MSDLTITAAELLASASGLRAIGNFSLTSGSGSFTLAKIKRQANLALEDLEGVRVALNVQHAKKDENGKPVTDDKGQYVHEDPAAFAAAWKGVLAEPVTLAGCRALTLGECEGATMVVTPDPSKPNHVEIVRGIPSDVFFALGPLVVEPSPPAAAS